MIPVDPGTVVFQHTVTVELPATLFGCRWVILRGSELPPPMKAGPGREDWFHPLRLASDGRVIAIAGLPQQDEEAARKQAASDIAGLEQAEADYLERTGRAPEPLKAAAVTIDGVPWEPRVELPGA